jgi:hypothetical protein
MKGGWLNPHDYPYLYEIHCCELPDDIESGKLTTTTTTTTTTASTAAGNNSQCCRNRVKPINLWKIIKQLIK